MDRDGEKSALCSTYSLVLLREWIIHQGMFSSLHSACSLVSQSDERARRTGRVQQFTLDGHRYTLATRDSGTHRGKNQSYL